MKKSVKFSPEVRERAVRMVFESRPDHPSRWATVESIAAKIGCTTQTLRTWVRQHERSTGQQEGPISSEQQSIKALEREVKELRKANEILRLASCGTRYPRMGVLVQPRPLAGVHRLHSACRG